MGKPILTLLQVYGMLALILAACILIAVLKI